ncbi:MAG: hypothetical protein ACI3XI_01690 [Eubacteriales bacterium]
MKKTDNYRAQYGTAIKSFAYTDDELGIPAEISIYEELQCQLEREKKSASEYPECYRLADIMNSSGGSKYRTGNGGAEPYMTYEDYVRLILAETKISEYGKRETKVVRTAVRPATVYNVRDVVVPDKNKEDRLSSRESVIEGTTPVVKLVECSDSTLKGKAIKHWNTWFPTLSVVKPDRKVRRRASSSAAGIAWVMIFALVIALPIALGVVKSEAASNLLEKQEELAALEKKEDELIAEFESSIDLREIEKIAVNDYGMIKLGQSTIRVLRLNGMDSIESFSESQTNTVLPALLSALGIRQSNE